MVRKPNVESGKKAPCGEDMGGILNKIVEFDGCERDRQRSCRAPYGLEAARVSINRNLKEVGRMNFRLIRVFPSRPQEQAGCKGQPCLKG